MNEELLRELQSLQRAAAHLRQVTANMQAPAMSSVEREDRSGAILVRLGGDGLPDRMRVSEDWPRRIHPGDIGQAVVEAYGTAMSVRMQVWTAELERDSWGEGLGVPAVNEDTEDGWGKSPSKASEVPSMSELAEEAISLLGEAAETTPEEQPRPTVSPSKRVVISLSGGHLNSCEVDARWARRQSARSLATALNSALNRARSAMEQETADREASQEAQRQRAQALFNNALAVIKDPERFAK